jgi:hypothetical protein
MLGLSLTLAALAAPDYPADQRQASQDFAALAQQRAALLASGDLAGAEQLYLERVPEEKRTAAHYVMLGDAFGALDPEFARAQLAKAFALEPEEQQVAQYWAAALHRAGRCAEAEPLYARALRANKDGFVDLLRIDCLVRSGRPAEALELWRTTRELRSLGKAFRAVPERVAAGETREHRRLLLRKELAAGETRGAEELVFLDLMRTGGPRRFEVEGFELELDRGLVGRQLDPASRRSRELWAVCDFWLALWERGFPPAGPRGIGAQFGERSREFGWLEAGGAVPGHALVARWATTALLESGLRQPAELLADWERALASRLEEGEADAGRALLELQRAAGSAQAAETERLLWEKTHDLDAAVALLERRAEKLESGDALLCAALERYPQSARLCALASGCARRAGKGEREALARQIAACFQPPGDLAGLQSAFGRLEELLLSGEQR